MEFPHLTHVFTPFLYLIGPIYYWYVKSIATPDFSISARDYSLHTIPFLLAILIFSPFFLLPADEKIALVKLQYLTTPVPLQVETFVLIAAQIVQSFLYIFKAGQVIKSTAAEQSKKIQIKVLWLRRFSLLFLIYWTVDFVALCMYMFIGNMHVEVFYVTMLCSALFINALVFFAIKNNKDFSGVLLNSQAEKYRNSALNVAESKLYMQKIITFMTEKRPYLDAELSLGKFSQDLEISSHQISQVLNLEMGKSFYEFINEYRYKEAKDRLQKPEYKHLTILAIALDSGFSNKNTFNKVFKKHAGSTPSQFLKEHTTFRRSVEPST